MCITKVKEEKKVDEELNELCCSDCGSLIAYTILSEKVIIENNFQCTECNTIENRSIDLV